MIGSLMLAWFTDPWTYIIVGLVALLLFGKRLPEVGRSLGRGIAEFKRGLRDVQDEVLHEDQEQASPKAKLRVPPADEEAAARKHLGTEAHEPAATDTPPDAQR